MAEKSLQEHVDKLEKERINVVKKEFDDIQEIEKPKEGIEKGYSQIAEIECEVPSFPLAVNLVINYGPTMVDILEPNKIEMSLGEAQDSLNTVAGMMQRFVEAGAGGVVIADTD